MKKIILLAPLLFIELSIAMAGNPIMGIRCRGGAVALNIDSEQVISNAEGFSPDCSALADCVESCPEEDLYWNTSTLACGCDVVPGVTNVAEEVTFFSACGCPEGLGDGDGGTVFTTPDESDEGSFGFQTCIPYEDCFDGDISFVLAPLTCDLPSGEDTIRVTITQADGSPLPPGAFVTIESLVNCDLIDEDDVALLALLDQFDGDVSAAFQADADGVILIEFTRDLKTEASILDFGDYGMMTVPGCPTLDASDPCSCNPQNITDADGTVLFWYDELTIIGTPDSIVKLVSNNNPQGFLMFTPTPAVGATTPFSDNTDFPTAIDANGELVIPYFRSADAPTIDILYSYQGGTAETSFTETCGLAPTACIADPIPTLGEWGLMIMALLLMIIGVVSFQYKGKTLIPVKERVRRE